MEFSRNLRHSALIGVASLSLAGCERSTPASSTATPSDRLTPLVREDTKAKRLAEVVHVGSGVYSFPVSPTFAETLADFRDLHKGRLRIVSVTQGPDVVNLPGFNSSTSSSTSFIVVTEEVGSR